MHTEIMFYKYPYGFVVFCFAVVLTQFSAIPVFTRVRQGFRSLAPRAITTALICALADIDNID